MRIKQTILLAAERTSVHAGTWWFAPVAGFIGAVVANILDVPITFFPSFPEGLLRTGLDAIISLLIAYAIIFTAWLVWFSIERWAKQVNPWLAITAIGAIIILVGGIGYIWDRSRGPIIWMWNYNSPISFWRQGNDPLLVASFNIKGRNRSDEPITITRAFITLDTAQIIPLMIVVNGAPQPATNYVIRPTRPFFLVAGLQAINPDWTGQRPFASTFRGEISQFTFSFEYNRGARYVIKFSGSDLDSYIKTAEVIVRPQTLER